MLFRIFFLHAKVVGNGANVAAYIASGVAGVVVAVGCSAAFINGTTHGALYPMLFRIFFLHAKVMGNGANVATIVAGGVAGVVVGMRGSLLHHSTATGTYYSLSAGGL